MSRLLTCYLCILLICRLWQGPEGRGLSEYWEAVTISIGEASDNITGGYELNDLRHLDLAQSLSFYFGEDNDSNLYTNLNQSKYWEFHNLINKFKNTSIPIILNINIQSLHSKFENLNKIILDLTSQGVFVLAITLQEVWSIANSNLISMDGFTFFHSSRKSSKGGGVGIYIRNGYSAKVDKSTSLFVENVFESLSIEFTMKKNL